MTLTDNFSNFNRSRLIAEMKDGSSGIPTDVIFQVVENGRLYEIKAHRMLLAMESPFFKTEFYATDAGDKAGNIIKIEETTFSALQITIDAVYNIDSMEPSLKNKSIHGVFDVLNLVNRYQIAELAEIIKNYLANYPLTDDTVLEVAGDTKEYINTFKAQAELLLRTCAKFLKAKIKDLDGVSNYAAVHEDKGEILSSLLARMKYVKTEVTTTSTSFKWIKLIATPFKWPKVIAAMKDESCGIPFDVTFQIVEDGQLHEVKAHKMIVAMVSDIFKTMFFSTQVGDKTSNVIKVEETTVSAFRIMIDAAYDVKYIGASLSGKSVDLVFEVVNLIERYQIKELMVPAKMSLANYPITDANVLEVAEVAMEYSNMFEVEAQDLLLTCAKFLKPKLRDGGAMIDYAAENNERKDVFATLLVTMKDIVPTECSNCKKEICQDGQAVRGYEFREGLIVTNNKATGDWGNEDCGTGRVTKVAAEFAIVKNIRAGVTRNGLLGSQFGGGHYCKSYNNGPLFLFRCN